MPESGLMLPSTEVIRQHVLQALRRYWPTGQAAVADLPVRLESGVRIALPLRLVAVTMPKWSSDCGVGGDILIPGEACKAEGDWHQVDWWLAAFLLLECWHERAWEEKYGPIHSYSLRLKGWDERVWQHAWVNRIALFLRLWAAQINSKSAEELFGPLPAPEFLMTHDVDAVAKTLPIRIKQGAFNLVNALRALAKGDLSAALARSGQAWRFLFGREDWWTLDTLLNLEKRSHLHGRYHFYADLRRKTPKRWLFDPGYDVGSLKIRAFMRRLVDSGAEIGLHPSFDSWQEATSISQQKTNLEAAAGHPCTVCRQHWLRFSWRKTWAAQEGAGIGEDTTLMFNDRPGLRNASAVAWHPWQTELGATHQLIALPTVIMDSHFYDYQPMTPEARREAMAHWVSECRMVFGQVAILWHPHTLTADYGWRQGFVELLDALEGFQ
jgi:hypothetical protein